MYSTPKFFRRDLSTRVNSHSTSGRTSSLFAILAQNGLWRVVSEPLLTPPDQNFALRHASVIHAALAQGNRYRVTFTVFDVTGLQVIRADRDRDLLALSADHQARFLASRTPPAQAH